MLVSGSVISIFMYFLHYSISFFPLNVFMFVCFLFSSRLFANVSCETTMFSAEVLEPFQPAGCQPRQGTQDTTMLVDRHLIVEKITTVDGRNPAPVEVGSLSIPLFTGFLTSQVVRDFFHQQYEWMVGVVDI